MSGQKSGSIFWAMIWMAVLSCLLFWLPVAGPLVAGFVGGKKAGGVVLGLHHAGMLLVGAIIGGALA